LFVEALRFVVCAGIDADDAVMPVKKQISMTILSIPYQITTSITRESRKQRGKFDQAERFDQSRIVVGAVFRVFGVSSH
jgi:hypothetical protein